MSKLMIIGAISSGISAVQQMQAGRAQARAYQAQARQEELKGRRDALAYRQQGVEVLRKVRGTISTVTARAAAGGLNPYSGSAQSLRNYAEREGVGEFYLSQENAELAIAIGEVNRDQNLMAAQQARRQGMMSALTTIGTTAMTMGAIGGPSSNIGGFAGGGSVGGAVSNTLYPTTGSLGMPSMVPGG